MAGPGLNQDFTLAGRPAAPAETIETTISYYSDTDFSHAIDGKPAKDVWPLMDELMSTIQVLLPRLYDGVMRRLP